MRQLYKRILIGTVITTLLWTTACASDWSTKAGVTAHKGNLTSQTITPFPEDFVGGINRFGFEAVNKLYKDTNLSISPASIVLALSMIQAGATDETAAEIKQALFLDKMTDQDLLVACQQLMWRANSRGMQSANGIWMDKSYTFNKDYLKTVTEKFMSEAVNADFKGNAKGATDAINQWIKDKTNGKISDMNSEALPADTAMVLVNALFFSGDWETPFKADKTSNQTFNGTGGKTEVPFMHDTRTAPYLENSTFQMISLPFVNKDSKEKSPYAMAFILPAEGKSITDVATQLTQDNFAQITTQLAGDDVQISLPKFQFTFDAQLNDLLKSLGMTRAFDHANAQFGNLTADNSQLYLSQILHKAYIRIDEKGAEAAAATQGDMQPVSAPVDTGYKVFNADRPFLFAIYDQVDGTILFLGVTGEVNS